MLDPGRVAVKVPVGNTVADCKTSKVWLEDSVIGSVGGVVRIDSLGEVRNVDSGVRLASDVKLVSLVLWELSVPSEDGGQVVVG